MRQKARGNSSCCSQPKKVGQHGDFEAHGIRARVSRLESNQLAAALLPPVSILTGPLANWLL
jgi:hypothetical protein